MTSTPEWVKQAKVGDKVVALISIETTNIKRGGVYVISEISPIVHFDQVLIGLKFSNAYVPIWGMADPNFFRPVSKRGTETGMRILREIASNVRKPERV